MLNQFDIFVDFHAIEIGKFFKKEQSVIKTMVFCQSHNEKKYENINEGILVYI